MAQPSACRRWQSPKVAPRSSGSSETTTSWQRLAPWTSSSIGSTKTMVKSIILVVPADNLRQIYIKSGSVRLWCLVKVRGSGSFIFSQCSCLSVLLPISSSCLSPPSLFFPFSSLVFGLSILVERSSAGVASASASASHLTVILPPPVLFSLSFLLSPSLSFSLIPSLVS